MASTDGDGEPSVVVFFGVIVVSKLGGAKDSEDSSEVVASTSAGGGSSCELATAAMACLRSWTVTVDPFLLWVR